MAGLGWLGKNNLLVTKTFGCALCMCSVLTNAPLKTTEYAPVQQQCGNCNICKETCPTKVIKGTLWSTGTSRDDIVDIYNCHSCLECMVFCPWTQQYMKKI